MLNTTYTISNTASYLSDQITLHQARFIEGPPKHAYDLQSRPTSRSILIISIEPPAAAYLSLVRQDSSQTIFYKGHLHEGAKRRMDLIRMEKPLQSSVASSTQRDYETCKYPKQGHHRARLSESSGSGTNCHKQLMLGKSKLYELWETWRRGLKCL
jgi:hypothetical protein